MSLVRNFTKRARAHTRGDRGDEIGRSCTVKYAPGTISRAKISLPTELLSTTNVDALNAPDIRKVSAESSGASSSDSIHSDNDFSSIGKSFLTADNSSNADLSPSTPLTPFSDFGISNEFKDFFSSKPEFSMAGVTLSVVGGTPASEPVPAVPQRAPSHSKKAHVELSRQRSFKRSLSPPPLDIAKPNQEVVTRDTAAIFSEKPHPFGRELAKVDETVEGFGATMVLEEEEQEMLEKGLQKFTVADYLAEITGIDVNGFTGGVFEDKIGLNPWM